MNRMIFQVSVGKPSKLYEHCIESVAQYCEKYDIEHIVLTQPKLRIKPDIFSTNRSEESYMKYGGCLLYTSPSPRDATLSRMPSSA